MNYTPRDFWKEFHQLQPKRSYIICHRRAGKSVANAAEMVKTGNNFSLESKIYTPAQPFKGLFISPLAEQSWDNMAWVFKSFGEDVVKKVYKTDQMIELQDGGQVFLGGAKFAERYRGTYLDFAVVDEYADVKPEVVSNIFLPALQDRDGRLAICGTTKPDNNYQLYNGYKYALEHPDVYDYVKCAGVYDTGVFTPEKIEAIKRDHFAQCAQDGLSYNQAMQSWQCEWACDFSFIDEGKPDMQSLFYNELSNLFTQKRILPPQEMPYIIPEERAAVFDLSHSVGRDSDVCFIVGYDKDFAPSVLYQEATNSKSYNYWYARLRELGITKVILPFDANTTNKETMLTTAQSFKKAGFDTYTLLKLLREEQTQLCRWLLDNAKFAEQTLPALRHVGRFRAFESKHDIAQDYVSCLCYAAQYLRKKGMKKTHISDSITQWNRQQQVGSQAFELQNGFMTSKPKIFL